MIYAIMKNGDRVYFANIDELFEFVNSNADATGGWIGP